MRASASTVRETHSGTFVSEFQTLIANRVVGGDNISFRRCQVVPSGVLTAVLISTSKEDLCLRGTFSCLLPYGSLFSHKGNEK